MTNTLQDNHTVHHGSVYWGEYVRQQEKRPYPSENMFSLTFSRPLIVKTDTDLTKTMGRKANQYELQGIPLRISVGPRDMRNGVVEVYRRDTDTKQTIKIEELAEHCHRTLHEMQISLLTKQKTFREENTVFVETYEEFKQALDAGKFVMAHRDGTTATELLIKEETKATIRCIPTYSSHQPWLCVRTGKPSQRRVLFTRA